MRQAAKQLGCPVIKNPGVQIGKPFPMFVHCSHSQQDMGVGIMSRRMGVMDGKISNHAFGNKLLLAKLPNKDSILVG